MRTDTQFLLYLASLKETTATQLGPSDHGRRMSLDAFDLVAIVKSAEPLS